jgi:hypothetical protein
MLHETKQEGAVDADHRPPARVLKPRERALPPSASTPPRARSKSSSSVGETEKVATSTEPTARLTLDELNLGTIAKLRAISDPFDQELFLAHSVETEPAKETQPPTNEKPQIKEQLASAGGWVTSFMSTIASAITPVLPPAPELPERVQAGRNLEKQTTQALKGLAKLEKDRQMEIIRELLIQHANTIDQLELGARIRIMQLEKEVAELKAKITDAK